MATPNANMFKSLLSARIENDQIIENAARKALVEGKMSFWIPEKDGIRKLAVEKGFTIAEIDHCQNEVKISFGQIFMGKLAFRNKFATEVSKEAKEAIKLFMSSFIIHVDKEYIDFAIDLLAEWEFYVERDHESLRVSF